MSIVCNFYKIFNKVRRLGYSQIYCAVDIHETILKPTWSTEEKFKFYPFAERCLKLMSQSDRFKLILWSSCSDERLKFYSDEFKKRGIAFDFLNCNPDAHNTNYADFSSKFYFDIGFDDKFGFCADIHWFFIFIILKIKGI